MENQFFPEAQKVWKRIVRDGQLNDVKLELELHKKLLEIFHVGKFYYWLFDIANMQFRYMSPGIKEVLGFEPDAVDLGFFMSRIHADDHATFLNHEEVVSDFFRNLPLDQYENYKVSYDYRVNNAANQPVRILHQVVVAQYDEQGNVLLTLGVHTDISEFKTSNASRLSFIGMNGAPTVANVNVPNIHKSKKPPLSKREHEILTLILNGESSAAIAQKLFLSKFTVDTHRKNILAKTGTRNTAELTAKMINEGGI